MSKVINGINNGILDKKISSSIAFFSCRPPSPNLMSPTLSIESIIYKLCIHYYLFINLRMNLLSSQVPQIFLVCKYFYRVFLPMGAIDQLVHQGSITWASLTQNYIIFRNVENFTQKNKFQKFFFQKKT